METLAVVLQGVFLALAFGLRTFLHARETGSTGLHVSASRTRAEAIGAGGILVAALGSLVAAIVGLADALEPIEMLDYVWLGYLGAAVASLGLLLVLAAQSNMGHSWRIGVDQSETTDLVTSGLFSLTRNPIFLGMLVFWFGSALLVPNPLSIASFVVALISVEVQVRLVEEPYLSRTHGDAYRAYARRTGRLLPAIGRLRDTHDLPA